jgi:hypothetical protein
MNYRLQWGKSLESKWHGERPIFYGKLKYKYLAILQHRTETAPQAQQLSAIKVKFSAFVKGSGFHT